MLRQRAAQDADRRARRRRGPHASSSRSSRSRARPRRARTTRAARERTTDGARAGRRRVAERGAEPAVHDEQAHRRRARLRAAQRRGSGCRSPRCSPTLLETTVFVFVGGGGRRAEEPRRRAEGRPRSSVAGLREDGRRARRGARRAGISAATRTRRGSRAERLGDDAGRVPQLVEVLGATFGPGATLGVADVEPYLGEAGSVPGVPAHERDRGGQGRRRARSSTGCSRHRARASRSRCTRCRCSGCCSRTTELLRRSTTRRSSTTKDAARRARRQGSTYPAQKALEAARALGTDGLRHGARLAAPGGPRPQGRQRDARGRGARGARGPARRAATHGAGAGPPRAAESRPGAAAGPRSRLGALFAAFIRRDVRRAAWFLWMMPLAPALPSRFCAHGPGARRRPRRRSRRPSVAPLIRGLQLGADGQVAHAPLLVLEVALLLALDVRHRVSRPRSASGEPEEAIRRPVSGPFAVGRAARGTMGPHDPPRPAPLPRDHRPHRPREERRSPTGSSS